LFHVNFGNEPRNSLYLLSRKIELGNFLQRVDAIFILLWIISIFSYLSFVLFLINRTFKKILTVSNEKMLSFANCSILFGLAIIPFKMWNLPVGELFMLGKKTVPKLQNMRIKTIGDLAKTDEEILIKKFGKFGKTIWEYANGIDNSEVNYKFELPKSVGNSITLPQDIYEIEKIEEVLLALSEQVAYRLQKYNLLANTVSVQLRTKDFQDFSHQGKLLVATLNTKNIYFTAKELLSSMYKKGTPIRLIGLRADKLVDKDNAQISLFDDIQNKKQDTLDKTLYDIKQKYGYNSITRAGKMNVNEIININKM